MREHSSACVPRIRLSTRDFELDLERMTDFATATRFSFTLQVARQREPVPVRPDAC